MSIQYNAIIRKLVIGFGNLFNQIQIGRFDSSGNEVERFLIPIAYAGKEKYVARLQGDPELDKKVQITLPTMSFEISGMKYDASRKQNTNYKNFAQSHGQLISQYNPVPYDFDFSLYVYVRNHDDGTQIIERILPFFTPDYTMKLNLVPEMGVVKEIPIILNDVSHEIDYEGDMASKVRTIIWTLNFTAKAFIYGQHSEAGSIIKTSITNTLNYILPEDTVIFNMVTPGLGIYKEAEIIYQGYSYNTATAVAKVVSWDSSTRKLKVKNISGHFVTSQPVYGVDSSAHYNFNSYETLPERNVNITVTPNPPTANVGDSYTYNVNIQEYPNG
jgi:hypothetical protein